MTSLSPVLAHVDGTLWLALAGAAVSVIAVAYSRRSTRASERTDARMEAETLADVRGKVIADLEERLGNIEKQQAREREDHANKIALIEKVLDHVRNEAAETQRLLVVGFRGAAIKILGHLEVDPPEVEQAIDYLRDMLNGDAPPPLRRRRRAA